MKENLALQKKKYIYIIFSQCVRVGYADVSVRSGQTYKTKKIFSTILHIHMPTTGYFFLVVLIHF